MNPKRTLIFRAARAPQNFDFEGHPNVTILFFQTLEDHHNSGDSIPIGCEASHFETRLDISQDSGMSSLVREPVVNHAAIQVGVITTYIIFHPLHT